MNLAEHKIAYMNQIAKENDLILKELPNGINVRNKDVSLTLYTGSKGTFCIDRFDGKIEKGIGFDNFKTKVAECLSSEYFSIDMVKALKMLFENKSVFQKINDDFIEVDCESDTIAELFNQNLYGKNFSIDVNGQKFLKKEDAINFINRMGG